MTIISIDEMRKKKLNLKIPAKSYLTLQVDLYPQYNFVEKPIIESDYSFVVAIDIFSDLEVLATTLGKAIKCENMDEYGFWTRNQNETVKSKRDFKSCGPFGNGLVKIKMNELFPLYEEHLVCCSTGHSYPGEWVFLIFEVEKDNFNQPISLPTILYTWGKLTEAPPFGEEYEY